MATPLNLSHVLTSFAFLVILAGSQVMAQQPVLVSIKHNDVSSGSGTSEDPVLSADGRFVAFQSTSFPLTAINTNGQRNIFVRDLQAGITTLVSVNRFGIASPFGSSQRASISADGRFVAFESTATDLVANDTNNATDIFVRDLQTGTTALVSVNSTGSGGGNQESLSPVISANGRVVVFKSFANNLVANDNNSTVDVFARDLQTGTTLLVSCNVACTGSGNGPSFPENVPKNKAPRGLISKDGRFIVFISQATDLIPSDTNGTSPDIFLRDLQTNTTTLVSVNRFGTGGANAGSALPVISGNGRFVFFQSIATDLTANDPGTVGGLDLFVRDTQTAVTTLVSVTTGNAGSNIHPNSTFFPLVSDDGRFVAFQSESNQYVTNDSNAGTDIFWRDLQTNTTSLVSVNNVGGTSAGSDALGAVMSADGRFVSFIGFGPDYVPLSDTNGRGDVYLRDMISATTTAMSSNRAGTSTADLGADYPAISADGRIVVFESSSRDLVVNTVNGINLFAIAPRGRAGFTAAVQTISESGGDATISITRNGSTSGPLTIQFATSNGSATAPSDFPPTSGSLIFADGETSKSFVVPILNDSLDEPDEIVSIILSDFASGSSPGSLDMTLLTITDDDPPPSVSIDDLAVSEGNTGNSAATFTLSLSAPSGKLITVDVSAAAGTASQSSDYSFFNPTRVNIFPGAVAQTFVVAITGDTTFEDDETFFLNLTNPVNVTIADNQGLGTILNDDPVPSLTVNDITVTEGDSGVRQLFFQIRLSNPSSRSVTVDVATADGTAKAPSDYQSSIGPVTFAPGQTVKIMQVNVNGDTLVEPDETLSVNLTNPSEASIVDAQGVGTILNDDFPIIWTEENSEQAIALETIMLVRDPFSLTRSFGFGSDLRTRVTLFVRKLELLAGEDLSEVTAQGEDELGMVHLLEVEHVSLMPNVDETSQVVVRLPDSMGSARELRIRITVRGVVSNAGLVRINP